jgi:hypothetical protein
MDTVAASLRQAAVLSMGMDLAIEGSPALSIAPVAEDKPTKMVFPMFCGQPA